MQRSHTARDQTHGCSRAAELARRFAAANGEVIAFVEGLAADAWSAPCEEGARSVGQVAGHIAAGHLIIGGIAEALALGLPLPVAARRTRATGARYNSRQATRFATLTPKECLRALRCNGGIVERFIAGLTADQLDRAIETHGGPVSAEDELERGLIGHMARHLDDVRAAVR
jgi:DinB superfamily